MTQFSFTYDDVGLVGSIATAEPRDIISVENPNGTVNIWQQLDDAEGNLVLNEDGTVSFKPDANFNGPATFTYTATSAAPAVFTAAGSAFSNGQALWAHASTKLSYVLRQHPFPEVQLKDEDITVDLSHLNGTDDRQVIVVTEPLTTNEAWVAMEAGELQAFVDGQPLTRTVCKATLIAAAAAAAAQREAEEAAKAAALAT